MVMEEALNLGVFGHWMGHERSKWLEQTLPAEAFISCTVLPLGEVLTTIYYLLP